MRTFSLVTNFYTAFCAFLKHLVRTLLHTLVAGLLARSQYPEGPATGHLDTGFPWFPCVYKRTLRWFPTLRVAAACFSCSPLDLNFLEPYCIFMYTHYNHCHRATAHLQFTDIYMSMGYYIIVWRCAPHRQIVTSELVRLLFALTLEHVT
jgi:hypothetical protein